MTDTFYSDRGPDAWVYEFIRRSEQTARALATLRA